MQIWTNIADNTLRAFILGAFLAFLNSFERADYNLALYVFAYAIWSETTLHPSTARREQLRVVYLITATLIIDLIYVWSWAVSYGNYLSVNDPFTWMSGVVHYTMVLTILEFIGKITLLTYWIFTKEEFQDDLSIEGVANSFGTFAQSFIGHGEEEHEQNKLNNV